MLWEPVPISWKSPRLCRHCMIIGAFGERVLSPRVSQALFEKIKKGDSIEATVTVPVLDGTYG
jgi:hypothetical protein